MFYRYFDFFIYFFFRNNEEKSLKYYMSPKCTNSQLKYNIHNLVNIYLCPFSVQDCLTFFLYSEMFTFQFTAMQSPLENDLC